MSRKVFITGMGVISAIGMHHREFAEGLMQGRSGVSSYEPLRELDIRSRKAAYVHAFDAKKELTGLNYRRLSRYTQFTYAAVRKAIEDSALDIMQIPPVRKGLIISTIRGSYQSTVEFLRKLYRDGPALASPLKFPQTVMNAAATSVAIQYQLKGASTVLTGSSAVHLAFEYLRRGKADVIIAGGVDTIAILDPFKTYDQLGILAREENGISEDSRPGDKDRNGMIYGEGAAFFVMEHEDHLKNRGGKALAQVLSWAAARDNLAVNALDRRDPEVIAYTMQEAMNRAGLVRQDIQAVVGMANSTVKLDCNEGTAIDQIFCGKCPAVTTPKGNLGETFGASDALNIAAALIALETQKIFPILNLKHPDQHCKVPYVSRQPMVLNCEHLLVNSFELGGLVQTTLLRKAE